MAFNPYPPVAEQSCANCFYSREENWTPGSKKRFCRINPPSVLSPGQAVFGVPVKEDYWCGGWEPLRKS